MSFPTNPNTNNLFNSHVQSRNSPSPVLSSKPGSQENRNFTSVTAASPVGENKSDPFGISNIWGNNSSGVNAFGSVGDSRSKDYDRAYFNSIDENPVHFGIPYEHEYSTSPLDPHLPASPGFGMTSQNQAAYNGRQSNSLGGSKLAQFFRNKNDTTADSGFTTNSVSSVEVGSGRPVASNKPSPFSVVPPAADTPSINTFPSVEDFTPCVFLPNDLLSSSSSTSITSSFQQKQSNISADLGKSSSSYYSLSPETPDSQKKDLQQAVGNRLGSLSLKSPQPQHLSWSTTTPSTTSPEFLSSSSPHHLNSSQSLGGHFSSLISTGQPSAAAAQQLGQDCGCQTDKTAEASAYTMTALTMGDLDRLDVAIKTLREEIAQAKKSNTQLQVSDGMEFMQGWQMAHKWVRLVSDPPENCHLNVKKLPKT